MKQIWKFPLDTLPGNIYAPALWRPLCVQMQNGKPCMWAEVTLESSPIDHKINIYGTGWDMPNEPGHYVGSFITEGGLVFHVYTP